MGTFADVYQVSKELEFMGSKYALASSAPDPLADLTGDITEVDGLVFRALVAAGFSFVAAKKDELNRINIFPMPDADTGSNMTITLRTGALNQLYEPTSHLQEAVARYAEDVLMSGQGNSGTVLTHFWTTLSSLMAEAGGKPSVSVPEFANFLEAAGKAIHTAFPADKMKEGTIVSVVRKSTALAGAKPATLSALTEAWMSQAKTALYETPNELEVDGVFILKDAAAKDPTIDSDSGAKGFFYLVSGMHACTQGPVSLDGFVGPGSVKRVDEHSGLERQGEVFDGSEKHKYCTECVIELKEGATTEAIETRLSDPKFGDSLVIVSAPSAAGKVLAKVHIHCDEPSAVFDVLNGEFNNLKIPIKEKAENMRQQVLDSKRKRYNPNDFKVTFVIDSTGQVAKWTADAYAFVPNPVSIFGQPYSCQLEPPNISVIDVMNRARHEDLQLVGSAPPKGWYEKVFRKALEIPEKPVIYIGLAKLMSATHQNSLDARLLMPEAEQDRVTCLDHGYMFGPSVPIMRELLNAANKGYDREQLVKLFDEIRVRGFYTLFMNTTTVLKMVKFGRVPQDLGDKVKELPDDQCCMAVGTHPCQGPAPSEYPKAAASLKNPVMETITGVGAKEKGYREILEKLRDSLKPGEVVRGFTCAEFIRDDLTDKMIDMAVEILGDKLAEPPQHWGTFIALAMVCGWGGAFMTYWIDDGKTSRPL